MYVCTYHGLCIKAGIKTQLKITQRRRRFSMIHTPYTLRRYVTLCQKQKFAQKKNIPKETIKSTENFDESTRQPLP